MPGVDLQLQDRVGQRLASVMVLCDPSNLVRLCQGKIGLDSKYLCNPSTSVDGLVDVWIVICLI